MARGEPGRRRACFVCRLRWRTAARAAAFGVPHDVDHHLAEDLLQGALAKVAMRWERVRYGEPEAYVRRIIYRDSISWWREHRRESVRSIADDRGTPDGTAAVDDRLALLAALQRLTAKQRAVVVLRFYEDMTEQHAAHVLGVSVGTVKSQTHVALQRLRTQVAALELREPETEAK